uniref:(northern house mosquito) hypothetical protein n=1 Tax=Culex pipiens TaxID=7175 RepID=A0A8D8MLV9_CULPI
MDHHCRNGRRRVQPRHYRHRNRSRPLHRGSLFAAAEPGPAGNGRGGRSKSAPFATSAGPAPSTGGTPATAPPATSSSHQLVLAADVDTMVQQATVVVVVVVVAVQAAAHQGAAAATVLATAA